MSKRNNIFIYDNAEETFNYSFSPSYTTARNRPSITDRFFCPRSLVLDCLRMMKLNLVILFLLIVDSSCQRTEQIIVEDGQAFSFDCKSDQSIYFARRLGQWSDIRENVEQYSSFNLNFDSLKTENIIRVSSDSAQSQHVGYYACRKPSGTTSSMARVYQLIIPGKSTKLVFLSTLRFRGSILLLDIHMPCSCRFM